MLDPSSINLHLSAHWCLGHPLHQCWSRDSVIQSVLASQPVSRALRLSSLRQKSPLLSVPPAMHLRASPHPVNSLPLIEFSLLFILLSALYLSLLSPFPSLFLSQSPPFSLLLLPPTLFLVFQRVSTFSILRCEIHFDTGLEIEWNRQYAPICSSVSLPLCVLSLSSSVLLFSDGVDPLCVLTFTNLLRTLCGKGLFDPNLFFLLKKGLGCIMETT